uniref:GH10 domain-containing protein n=1 Tax=Leersia perrieri TaxID=77586 RepID=A0A0D9VQV8_9ORYZ
MRRREWTGAVLLLVWLVVGVINAVAAAAAASMAQPLAYDYSSSSELVGEEDIVCVAVCLTVSSLCTEKLPGQERKCLPEPMDAHYGGGIIRNGDFTAGLQGWSAFGYGSLAEGTSLTGNKFAVATNRTRPYQSVSQKVLLQNDTHYTLSAWLQVSDGIADVRAVVKTADGKFIHSGGVEARSGCWSILKGGLTATAAGPAELYFESNATADIWVDNVSLQPFTREEWRAHHDAAIKKTRKKTVRLQAKDGAGNPVPGAQMHIEHVRNGFPLGSAMSREILTNPGYQRWFTSRFTVTTFENEMKWYSTEAVPGREDYSVPDAMLRFAKSHGIAVRGHNIFWDDPSTQMGWVKALSGEQLRSATARRIKSVMSRYAGQVIAWDVVNENLHFDFFEGRFGWEASAAFYRKAHQMDAGALMSMNEFNTLEQPGDFTVLPGKYLRKLWQIKAFPGNGNAARMAIGLEGHFSTHPNIPYIRAALDTMAQANVPVWLTEIDVAPGPDQASHLEQILREVYSHPAVHGIILWTAWHPQGCYVMCLTDNNFRNNPAGDVVDKLIWEWRTRSHVGIADADGYYEAELFHGDYKVTVTHPAANSTVAQSLSVGRESDNEFTIHYNALYRHSQRTHSHPYEYTHANPTLYEHLQKLGRQILENDEVTTDASLSTVLNEHLSLRQMNTFLFAFSEQLATKNMKIYTGKLVLFLVIVLFEGCLCLKSPEKPLYGGGILKDGGYKAKSKAPVKGSVLNVEFKKDHHYAFSAWLQLSKGAGDVRAVMVTPDGKFNTAGVIVVQCGCWTMLKGGATSYAAGKGDIFFESNVTAEIMADGMALQPFSFDEWKDHRTESIKKERKKKVKITVEGADGKALADAEVKLERVAKGFPLGNAMTKEILDKKDYEKWFTSRFQYATLENEMKWYSTEYHQNQEDYRVADKMVELAAKYNITLRGHNVFWDDQHEQMKWVSDLSVPKLKEAMAKRLKNVVTRYAGKVIHWDVVNENLHFSFFEGKLGEDASAQIFKDVAKLDSNPILFMNEFNTIEQPNDPAPLPTKYLAKLKKTREFPGNSGLKYGIGLESHFGTPNIPYMRGSLDTLAQAKVPIWLTEVDVDGKSTKGKQVEYLEEVMREGFAHPAVKGIVLWAAWHAKGCYVMCLTDNNFKNLPTGDAIDKLLAEWKAGHSGKTDSKGVIEAEMFHGEYSVTIKHHSLKQHCVQTVDLDSKGEAKIKAA